MALTDKSAISHHCWLTGYQVEYQNTEVLYRSDNLQKSISRESVEIAVNNSSLNQEEGARLSMAWLWLHDKLRDEAESWTLTAHTWFRQTADRRQLQGACAQILNASLLVFKPPPVSFIIPNDDSSWYAFESLNCKRQFCCFSTLVLYPLKTFF